VISLTAEREREREKFTAFQKNKAIIIRLYYYANMALLKMHCVFLALQCVMLYRPESICA